jgi:hypothetical protein
VTPAENQQTVEAREGIVTAYEHHGDYVGCIGRKTWDWLIARPEIDAAALRDLVAQADRAAELEADRNSLRDYIDTLIDDIEAYCDSCDRAGGFPSTATLRKIVRTRTLAGDGGGADG